jgi:hypothetical protein
MRVEVCPTCERIIPDSAMVCEHCGVSAARPFDELPTESEARADTTPVPVPAVTQAAAAGIGRRELMMIVVAVVGSGAITLAMLTARGGVTPTTAAHAETMPAGARPKAAAAPAGAPGWIESRAQWTAGDRKSLAFELPSRNETPVWMKNVRPLLVVRCLAKRTDVFVFTDSAAAMEKQDEDHTVRIAFDDEPERTERWPDSVAHDALFAPDGTTFARQLVGARTMRFGYTPHNAAPVVAHFDVQGLGDRLSPGAPPCGGRK